MKKALVMLVTVVLSLPLLSFGGSESSIGHTKSAVSNSKSNSNNRGTLTVAPSITSATGDQTGSNAESTSTATASITSIQTTTQPAGLNPPGFGTAHIDGVMIPEEWDNAVKINFLANVPPSEGVGRTTPATLSIMNDGLYLYLAIKVDRPSFGLQTLFQVDFDNNNNGIAEDGDDGFQMTAAADSTPPTFLDTYRYTCPGAPAGSAGCNAEDTNTGRGILPAGTNDGHGTATNDGTVTIMMIRHLLNSTDTTHDFSLRPGSKVGYHVTLKFTVTTSSHIGPMGGPMGGPMSAPIGVPTVSSAETELPSSGGGTYSYQQFTITSPIVTRVIDIKPGGRENSINRKSEGKIPVAILSAPDFNAPQLVDRTSLTFGHTGDEQSLSFCNEGSEDVNGDGLPDLVCHFKTQVAGFQSGDSFGIVNGRTTDGSLFTAKDSVRIVQ